MESKLRAGAALIRSGFDLRSFGGDLEVPRVTVSVQLPAQFAPLVASVFAVF